MIVFCVDASQSDTVPILWVSNISPFFDRQCIMSHSAAMHHDPSPQLLWMALAFVIRSNDSSCEHLQPSSAPSSAWIYCMSKNSSGSSQRVEDVGGNHVYGGVPFPVSFRPFPGTLLVPWENALMHAFTLCHSCCLFVLGSVDAG